MADRTHQERFNRNAHSNPYFGVDHVGIDYKGVEKDFYVCQFGVRAAVLVISPDEEVLLERQYRLLPAAECWEVPGGKVEQGEKPAGAAVRECYEETGVFCEELELLVKYNVALDTVNNPTYVFLCRKYRVEEFRPNEREVVAIEWRPVSQALEDIGSGEIQDSLSVIALSYYHCHSFGKRGRSAV